jgi:putative ubiquitin-RnfH superfamily antitoxin RatB of RatAB toxin-antitoxin module
VTVRVTVAIALAGSQEVISLELADGATIADALEAARVAERMPGWNPAGAAVGVWSRRRDASTPLRDGDRVEVYRPLQADPKQMRRTRARTVRGHKGRRT